MGRFVGVKDNHIFVVSDKPLDDKQFEIVEVPPELVGVSAADLIVNCRVHNGTIKCKSFHKPASQIKLALVGNWKMRCGIATYSENLWSEVVKHVGQFKLFIEKNELTTGDIHRIGAQTLPEGQVSVCWKRGESPQNLIKELKEYDPDIIWIQHEFGLWPNASYWLSMMSQLSDYRVIVTMHSVFHHRDKTIVEAAMPEIITHLEGGKQLLKEEKGIAGKVHVIPHGCYAYNNERLWNFYKSDKTFMQFGFGFRYKGWENSIRATGILKQKYPNVFFTGLFTESPYAKVEHQTYYNELMTLVDQLELRNNVAILRGYQSDAVLDSFLRTNQVTVFPYVSHPDHEVFGASGAARMAMSKGLPVITSSVNHFSDLCSIKADTPEQLANELDKLFSNPALIKEQVERQKVYAEDNSWANVALRHIKIFEE
jgi:glycosyltransferase involved in cell wall biosynthesis